MDADGRYEADMQAVLEPCNIVERQDTADLKGTDAAAMSLWNRDILAAALVPFSPAAWPQRKGEFSTVAVHQGTLTSLISRT